MSAQEQRDRTIQILQAELPLLSQVYSESYLAMGRGGILLYASKALQGHATTIDDYRTKSDLLDVFDAPHSHAQLKEMIENYDPRREGIMTLVTDFSNATFFITFKLEAAGRIR